MAKAAKNAVLTTVATLSVSLGAIWVPMVEAGSYVKSPSGVPVRDTQGVCVRTTYTSSKLQPGCDPMDRVILLPDAEGKVGAVIVAVGQSSELIDSAYGSVQVGEAGEIESLASSAEEVQASFGQLLATQPRASDRFVVRFLPGSATELTPDSAVVIQAMLDDLSKRKAPEIRVTGHTDTVGSLDANDRLSKQRAQTVVDILAAQGISLDLLEAAGRGERELAVPTADNVDEPDNRRVEIIVR